MKQCILFLTFLFLLSSCKNEKPYIDSDGIEIENISSFERDTLTNPYNKDNKIYVPNREYIFDYYQTKNGEKLKFSFGGTDYIASDQPDRFTIAYYGMRTMADFGHMSSLKDYAQSVIQFKLYDINDSNSFGQSQTGVIENERNVWIHPIRMKNFKVLEMNPFPFIKAPYEVGNKWQWDLKIGDHWSDPNWMVWSGAIENKIEYEITAREKMNTIIGEVDTYIIEATAKSRLGTTKLKTYFNDSIGFFKHEYLNIDGSEFFIELIEIRELE